MQPFRTSNKLNLLLYFIIVYWNQIACSTSPCSSRYELKDWVKTDNHISRCGGYYTPFFSPIPNFSQPSSMPIDVTFDYGNFSWEGQSTIYGAQLIQGQRWLEADELTLTKNNAAWVVEAKDRFQFHQPNMSIAGHSAFYRSQDEYLALECGDFRWYPRHARAQSNRIESFSQEKIILYDATFTTCPPDQTSWSLSAEKITLYPHKGRAKAKNIALSSYHVPIFYWPYLNYPIDGERHSGFLFPTYNSSSQSGLSISIPYYFNLAPNYDLTLTLNGSSKRGAGLQTEFRYLTEKSRGDISLVYFPSDHAYQNFIDSNLTNIPTGFTSSDPRIIGLRQHNYRFGLAINHIYHIQPNWWLDVQYHHVSDDNFFVDLGNDIQTTSTIHLPQRLQSVYQSKHWQHIFRVESYQVLQPLQGSIIEEIYRREPQWQFEANYPNLQSLFDFSIRGEAVRFTHPGDPLTKLSRIAGNRFFLQPQIEVPIEYSWGLFVPSFYLDMLAYDLKQPIDLSPLIDLSPSHITPIGTFDMQLFLNRSLHWGEKSFYQTLSPRAYYVYIPARDQSQYPLFDSGMIQFNYAQLFRYNRFSGVDRLNEANQISLSLNSSLFETKNQFEWLRFGIGQILYFRSEKVQLCAPNTPAQLCNKIQTPRTSRKHSNILSELVLQSPAHWQIGTFIEWGINQSLIQQASAFFHTELHPNALMNINYYFTRNDIKSREAYNTQDHQLHQGDISFLFPIHQHINLLSRVHYDFNFKQIIEMLGGIEYDGCCFATQIVASRYRQLGNAPLGRPYSNQLMFQFVFKGLSNLALNQSERALAYKIPGYRPLSERAALPSLGPSRYSENKG